MKKTVKISNGILTAEIAYLGAEMQSLKRGEEEFLKTESSEIWPDRAPVLFPICGCLKDDKYVFCGKEYFLGEHGFAYMSEFEVENLSDDSVVFLLRSSEKTMKVYPFSFEFRVKYALKESTMAIEYQIKNTGSGDMYFSVGSHEGYVCPDGIEVLSVIFEYEEKLDISLLDGVLLNGRKKNMLNDTNELPLLYDYYNHVDTLVFENLKSRKLSLKNRLTGKRIEVDYPDAENLLIWTAPGEKYICIEPWSGLPDFSDSDYDITRKKGIIKLGVGEISVKKHNITI